MGEVVTGVVPVRDLHAALNELIDLLIKGGGWFGKLQFPAPRKKYPPMVRFQGEAWGVLLYLLLSLFPISQVFLHTFVLCCRKHLTVHSENI